MPLTARRRNCRPNKAGNLFGVYTEYGNMLGILSPTLSFEGQTGGPVGVGQ
jgi:hypothetical protein